tara:strand:- start:3168 stop:4598 length:1431 start_codon:yes stop_codon:yes gene_type:complete
VSVATDPLPTKTKLLYGFGSIAYGIKDSGFATFLLFYYNQVVGMRADLVSLAIALALFVDAFIDPLIGQWTDRTRTQIGRRHPWLYASAIPICVSWLLLWHPPQANEMMQFFYLLSLAIMVRISLSLNEVPGLALLPELTKDYDDRTSILRYRFLFGWGGGLTMTALAYAVFLAPTDAYPNGLLNPAGYSTYAIIGAFVMAFAVLIAARSTHTRIVKAYRETKHLPAASESLMHIFATFRFRPFMLLMLAGTFAFANQGLVFALTPYLLTHVWLLEQTQLFIYAVSIFAGAILAFLLINSISQRFGKSKTAAVLTLISMVFSTLPYWLRMIGLFPEPGSPALLPIILVFIIFATASGIGVMICTMSMMADVTDAYEYEANKKSEGVFSSGMWFMQKTVGGLGILFAGIIISIIQLPDKAPPGSVDIAIVNNLALIFASMTVIIGLVGAWAYTLFPLSQQDHIERIEKLANAQAMVK